MVYSVAAKNAKMVVLACFAGLIILFTLTTLIFGGNSLLSNVVIWVLQITPLLLCLRGMLKSNAKSFVWLSFAVLLYFCIAVLYMFAPTAGIIDAVRLGLIVGIFVASVLFVRWQSRALSQGRSTELNEEKEYGK